VIFTPTNVADKRGIAKRQTRKSANTNITIAMRSGTKTKKVKVVKEDSPFQTRQIVVVSHEKATQQSMHHRSYVTGIKSINQAIGLDQFRQQEKRTATLNDPRPNRSSNPDAD
jgi:YbbR domain-containing protein